MDREIDPLPPDVVDRIERDFAADAGEVARMLLDHRQYGVRGFLGDRLVRCVIQAAEGDLHRVQPLIELSHQDYRDVIFAGEYDQLLQRIRDLSASFLIDSPEKFWIGAVARMMSSRGYRLVSLESNIRQSPPFDYDPNAGDAEGRATFHGPKGEIRIQKENRLWTVLGTLHEHDIHELHRGFHDESEFIDAVSGYLLSDVVKRKD